MTKFILFFIIFITRTLDSKVDIRSNKFIQYQCQNCRAPLEMQDILLAQAESVCEKETLYLCQKCRKEKQKMPPPALSLEKKPLKANEIMFFEDPAEDTRYVSRLRQRGQVQISKKNPVSFFLSLFSRRRVSTNQEDDIDEIEDDKALSVKILKIIDYEPYGSLIVIDDKNRPLHWYSNGVLKDFDEEMLKQEILDPILIERIKSNDPKNKISSLEEHRTFFKENNKSESDYSSIDYNLVSGLPHIYERSLKDNPNYDQLPEIPPRPVGKVKEPYFYLVNGVMHAEV